MIVRRKGIASSCNFLSPLAEFSKPTANSYKPLNLYSGSEIPSIIFLASFFFDLMRVNEFDPFWLNLLFLRHLKKQYLIQGLQKVYHLDLDST